MNPDLINRNCPMCDSHKARKLLEVNPASFINSNPTLNLEVIYNCGILNLPFIPLVQCKKCKFVYTQYILNEKWLNIVYNEIIIAEKSKEKTFTAKKRLSNLNLWYNLYCYYLSKHPNNKETINVLEYGCGWGDLLSTASSDGVKCIGIEYDKRKIDYCRKKGLSVHSSLKDIHSNIKFDIFVCNQVFEHLATPMDALSNIREQLLNDFIGYISVPNYDIKKLENSIKNPASDKNLNSWEHVNYFCPEMFWDFIRKFNFKVIDIKTGNVITRNNLQTTSCYITNI